MSPPTTFVERSSGGEKIKCVVWDLDHTVWDGILSEGDSVVARRGVIEAMRTLDERGILQSVASKNDFSPAWERLEAFGLSDYFLYPEINWGPKSESIRRIAENLNIALDTFAFVDDQPFERDEVRFAHPMVRVFDGADLDWMLKQAAFHPRFITSDSRRRRELYQLDIQRKREEESFAGPNEAFLGSLGMIFRIAPACAEDLRRVEELTRRTHQLNTTGESFSYDELETLRTSPDHKLLVAELEDRFGTYGKIGVVLMECDAGSWNIRLLLMSCRVMSRGVGGAFITFLRRKAADAGVALRARFRATERNRMMYVTYRFAGFQEVGEDNGVSLLENKLTTIPPYPSYLKLEGDIEPAATPSFAVQLARES